LKDLPKKDLRLSVDTDFQPDSQSRGQEKLITELNKRLRTSIPSTLRLTSARDAKRFAITLWEELHGTKTGPAIFRLMFHEISRQA